MLGLNTAFLTVEINHNRNGQFSCTHSGSSIDARNDFGLPQKLNPGRWGQPVYSGLSPV